MSENDNPNEEITHDSVNVQNIDWERKYSEEDGKDQESETVIDIELQDNEIDPQIPADHMSLDDSEEFIEVHGDPRKKKRKVCGCLRSYALCVWILLVLLLLFSCSGSSIPYIIFSRVAQNNLMLKVSEKLNDHVHDQLANYLAKPLQSVENLGKMITTGLVNLDREEDLIRATWSMEQAIMDYGTTYVVQENNNLIGHSQSFLYRRWNNSMLQIYERANRINGTAGKLVDSINYPGTASMSYFQQAQTSHHVFWSSILVSINRQGSADVYLTCVNPVRDYITDALQAMVVFEFNTQKMRQFLRNLDISKGKAFLCDDSGNLLLINTNEPIWLQIDDAYFVKRVYESTDAYIRRSGEWMRKKGFFSGSATLSQYTGTMNAGQTQLSVVAKKFSAHSQFDTWWVVTIVPTTNFVDLETGYYSSLFIAISTALISCSIMTIVVIIVYNVKQRIIYLRKRNRGERLLNNPLGES